MTRNVEFNSVAISNNDCETARLCIVQKERYARDSARIYGAKKINVRSPFSTNAQPLLNREPLFFIRIANNLFDFILSEPTHFIRD